MAAPRKTFRIEETAAAKAAPRPKAAPAPVDGNVTNVMEELASLRALLNTAVADRGTASAAQREQEQDRLLRELRFVHAALRGIGQIRSAGGDPSFVVSAARIAGELDAVIRESERATQKILAAAEDIDLAANNLSASLKGDFEHGLAQDIRERIIQIFEACNYQDLTSQRVSKVMALLGEIEQQLGYVLDEAARAQMAPPLHGPRLPSDRGHVTQHEVDRLFAGNKSAV